uniref:zinc finger protein RFP-like n=1 Tax=Podarcis muralis TaxID=64176 RepID=UPI0010A0AA20|nr:zinc finger protein RFP-like [Podarcis muralis]
MADEGPVQNLCEETTCSICREYFTDPVIIDCGHIFCQSCITEAWGNSDQDASCPQCREPCQQRNVRPNRQLASIVEIVKKFSLQMARGVEALGKVCERHQEPLKLFCKDDQAPICVVCDKSKEHRDHKVIPKEEAFEEYQVGRCRIGDQASKGCAVILGMGKTFQPEGGKQTDMERQKIMADFQQSHQFLEEQERLLLAQLKELDNEIKSCEDQHIAKLSEEMSSIDDLIKELEEKQKQPATEFLQTPLGPVGGQASATPRAWLSPDASEAESSCEINAYEPQESHFVPGRRAGGRRGLPPRPGEGQVAHRQHPGPRRRVRGPAASCTTEGGPALESQQDGVSSVTTTAGTSLAERKGSSRAA